MLTDLKLRSQVDALWDKFWTGGLANPNPPPSYEDLWRFTLVNYNAGPGCLGLAVDTTARAGEALDWAHVSTHFTPVCGGALDYINDIAMSIP